MSSARSQAASNIPKLFITGVAGMRTWPESALEQKTIDLIGMNAFISPEPLDHRKIIILHGVLGTRSRASAGSAVGLQADSRPTSPT